MVLAHVQSQIATVLDVSPASRISPDQGFFELGLDSLTSIELRNRLQSSLACRLPTTFVFDCPNINGGRGLSLRAGAPVAVLHRPRAWK